MTELAFPSGLATRQGLTSLGELCRVLTPVQVCDFAERSIDGMAVHSDDVRAGRVFFAVPGSRADGCQHVPAALARGATAVVANRPLPALGVPVVVVRDVRAAVADAARHLFRDPSASLPVVGITGTNGKTTAVHLARCCLEAEGWRVGSLGTIAYEFDGRSIPATHTTPDAVHLQGYLREMLDRGMDACVMEVSSHALAQLRVHGVAFRAGLFLNLSHDHLDYHGNMHAYAAAKARLFAALEPGTAACVNVDDPWARRTLDEVGPGVDVVTFGLAQHAMIRAEAVACTLRGTAFQLVLPHGKVALRSQLLGAHNVQNSLAAAAAGVALGCSELTIASALEAARPVRGRLQPVLLPPPLGRSDLPGVFVDYAHTPDALEKVCRLLAALGHGRLLVVFGCGGDRDAGKRPLMARAVARWADVAYLTSDNPRGEDPEAILDAVEGGLVGPADSPRACSSFYRIVDRERAIHRAVADARAEDVVLIAGKGHETYQVIGDSVIPFDDALVAFEALQQRATAGSRVRFRRPGAQRSTICLPEVP